MIRRYVSAAGVVVVLAFAAPALARQPRTGNGPPDKGGTDRRTHSVPEFDPSAVGALGALVAGGAVLLARRRR